MTEALTKFIETYPEKFQKMDLTEAYFYMSRVQYTILVSEFTDLMLNNGFNPLLYMPEVPYGYLKGSQYTGNETLTIPSNIRTIKRLAFEGSLFKTVIIREGCEVIQGLAFKQMPNLESVYLPKSLIRLGLTLFLKCKNIKTIYYPGTKEEFESIEGASLKDQYDWYKTAVGRIEDKCILICKDQTIELGIPG